MPACGIALNYKGNSRRALTKDKNSTGGRSYPLVISLIIILFITCYAVLNSLKSVRS